MANKLVLFDIDGTIIESYMSRGAAQRDFADVTLLPGRAERLAALRSNGCSIALITNQAGVAFGYNSEEDVCKKLYDVVQALFNPGNRPRNVSIHDGGETVGLLTDDQVSDDSDGYHVFVCYADERSRDSRYQDARRRKPSGAMLLEAAAWFQVEIADVLYIGDRPEDEQAAANAGVAFAWAEDFFNETR